MTRWRQGRCILGIMRILAFAILAFALGVLAAPGTSLATGFGDDRDDHDDDHWFGSHCKITKVRSITPTAANLGTYTPPATPAAVPVDITITFKTKGSGTCKGAIAFYRVSLPGTMSRLGGGGVRTYAIQTGPSGGTQLLFSSWPPSGHTLDFTVSGGSGTRTVTLRVYVLAQGGWLAAGSYSDGVLLKVLDRSSNHYDIVEYRTFTVSSAVQQSCNLPPPSVASLNFTSAISNGLPNATTLTVTFSGVACSAPARIRLSGEALKNAAIGPVANFDNFINWQATATFGAANVVLDTNPGSLAQATSAAQNVVSGPTLSATISLSVRLMAGQRIIAGHYSSILTVTIDPVL